MKKLFDKYFFVYDIRLLCKKEIKYLFISWLRGILQIVDGMITVISLGLVRSYFESDIINLWMKIRREK